MAAMDHPTSIRENKSSTTARDPPPFCRPNVGRIGHPFGVGLIGAEVALQQVGGHQCIWFTFRGDRAMAWALCKKSLFSHEASHSFARTLNALRMQFSMNPWAAIHAAIGLESRLHSLGKSGIFSDALAGRALRPGVVPTHRHL